MVGDRVETREGRHRRTIVSSRTVRGTSTHCPLSTEVGDLPLQDRLQEEMSEPVYLSGSVFLGLRSGDVHPVWSSTPVEVTPLSVLDGWTGRRDP